MLFRKTTDRLVQYFRKPETVFFCLIILMSSHLRGQENELFKAGNLFVSTYSHSDVADDPTMAKENLGLSVNSRYEDLNPIITADGKTLYFARKKSPENTGGKNDPQDIWFTTLNENGNWSRSKNLGQTINSHFADNLCGVSADNNTLVFYSDHHNGTGNFVIKSRMKNGWSAPKSLGILISNESHFLEASLAADGQALLFTAKNKNNLRYRKNIDERDIYVSLKNENGQWSAPINLGPSLNSFGDEYSPFLAADGKTLYFASNGRKGYGGVDIYVSKRKDDSWTNWTRPENLGPNINTRDFDAYYTVPASGSYAYMVSTFNSTGKSDILRIRLAQKAKPEPVIMVKGITLNAKTNQPVDGKITVESHKERNPRREAATNPSTGEFALTLSQGRYILNVSADGFIPYREIIEIQDISHYRELERLIKLVPLNVGEAILLPNIFFDETKADLKDESLDELNWLVDLLIKQPRIAIQLEGHTDNRGTEKMLFNLSRARVDVVKQYLVSKGINGSRIKVRGFGPSRPVVRNDSEHHRQMNRRVEFKILKK